MDDITFTGSSSHVPPPPPESGAPPPPPPPEFIPPPPPPDDGVPPPPPEDYPEDTPPRPKKQKTGWGGKKRAPKPAYLIPSLSSVDDGALPSAALSSVASPPVPPPSQHESWGEVPRALSRREREKIAQARRTKQVQEKKVNFEIGPEEALAQAALIKERYMGTERTSTFSAKKKRSRGSHHKKFNFDWNADDDTSAINDPNPIQRPGTLDMLGDQAEEERVRKSAEFIRQHDPETGAARAKLMIDMYHHRTEAINKKTLDNRHWSEKRLDEMRDRDWRIFKEDFNIASKGNNVPPPMRSWEESGLPQQLLNLVDRVGYKDPTPIQRAAIPIALQSHDLIGVAVTGSGKTASFLLPLLVYILDMPRFDMDEGRINDGPYSLVLAPTRELAQQIEVEARKFCTPLGFTVVSLVGGKPIEEQVYSLRNGAEIIIATPGRLVDLIERRMLVLSQCNYVIMDEADRMIDMGFEEPVNTILNAIPSSNLKPDMGVAEDRAIQRRRGGPRYRQTMMYTATMNPTMERIARQYLQSPAIITIGGVGEAVETVEQRVEFVKGEEARKKRLNQILSSGEFFPPVIVFVNVKSMVNTVASTIKEKGFSVAQFFGSKTQAEREAALASVRNGSVQVLVATDVAGRGIDVPDVSLVINFNMPSTIETYTHRIGRTGRAGKKGVAITFLSSEDSAVLYDLRQMIDRSPISKLPEELRKHEDAQSRRPLEKNKTDEYSAGNGEWRNAGRQGRRD
ncbi:Pre-mRNA-splicing ATP-dependent RNA helicase prp28 [Penicillium taxi]|uniref:Pre-mRNA-splicing ATP-dependent RNA helicase prp28 n=1 Tax=Penicillium taxi TaxID=168475 RepID=UPI00254599FE|nr:Pre-mRNA-splicing ATP-dependent RNA helicase prp28 [Penicillium taxi]KAJ5895100.1 Pre-mRNA-splicing ATP-dependent RNA helicase prp28 [Penicillium taxi]